MGKIFGGGGSSNAGARAAEAQAKANKEATAELRRQFGVSQELLQPFVEAGTEQLPALTEGTTAEGLDARLSRLFDTDIFGSLVEERTRSVEGQLAASGQLRSGTGLLEAARVPTDLGLALEGLLTGRSQDLAQGGQGAALGLAGAGSQNAQSIANILQSTGRARSSGIVTDQQAAAQRGQNTLNTIAGIGGSIIDAGGIGKFFSSFGFSDPNLKTNVEVVGRIVDLDIYEWDWIDEVKETIIGQCSNLGFMANEVKEKYPEFISEFGGFMTINIPGLLDKLEAKI